MDSYNIYKKLCSMVKNCKNEKDKETLMGAAELVQKDIAASFYENHNPYSPDEIELVCTRCRGSLGKRYLQQPYHLMQKYCSKCGQKIFD